ncbi:hypothetical protein J2128_002583 [Methanomicrobium sp. W14]|uniref:hypothetical protein n=1 Tax=Methanomicrobium sp. W14 TaxID=2817839 RepID=UPI001AE50EA5|nr:hypothetical protein [Methanomicrobium sp. W14]MBP2134607.1 hypothetical protein [Methanomicrobium sp. W14]
MKKMIFILSLIAVFCFFEGCMNYVHNESCVNLSNTLDETGISDSQVLANHSGENIPEGGNNLSDNATVTGKTKKLISALFPQIIPETIKDPEYVPGSIVPGKKYLNYDNVMSTDGDVYEITLDPDTYDLVFCGIVSATKYKKAEKKVSFDDAKEIASNFLKILVSNSSENYLDGYLNSSVYVYYTDLERNDTACGIDLDYTRVIDGTSCLQSKVDIEINSITGDVVCYNENWPDLSGYEFSSPNPDYSLEYAQGLVESTIDEKYPGEIKKYQYVPIHGGSDEIQPLWYDDRLVLNYEKDQPIDLVWAFHLKPDLNPGYSSDQIVYSERISAHTGEIYDLFYNGIHIYHGEKYGII